MRISDWSSDVCSSDLVLKRAVEAGRFGRIHLVALNVFWTRPQDYYDAAKWRGTWEFDGGALMNQASHYIDLLGWLIGPVESVQAYSATLERNIEAEDTAVAALRSEERRVGNECVSKCRARWAPYHKKKQTK